MQPSLGQESNEARLNGLRFWNRFALQIVPAFQYPNLSEESGPSEMPISNSVSLPDDLRTVGSRHIIAPQWRLKRAALPPAMITL